MASTLQSGVAGLLCGEEGGVRMEGHHQYGDGDGWEGRGLPIPINPGFQSNNTWPHRRPPRRTELAMCPASISDLPSEILEHILLSLPPVEIVKMKEVLLVM